MVKTLETNEWVIINSIIYKIHSIASIQDMQTDFLNSIKLIVPFDVASFYLPEFKGSHNLTRVVGNNMSSHKLERCYKNFAEIDYRVGFFSSPTSSVYRVSDLFSENARKNNPYFNNVHKPLNLNHTIVSCIVHESLFEGVVTLNRYNGEPDFAEKDVFIMDIFKQHLALRLFNEPTLAKPEVREMLAEVEERFATIDERAKGLMLTSREVEVLKMLLGSSSDEEVCRQLFISPNTLKKHLFNIYRKTGVSNRVQLYKLVT